MLRAHLNDRLRDAVKAREAVAVSTVRLILTAVKDRDIAARGKGDVEGISDQEILRVLRTMIRQREETIALCEKGGRETLAKREAEEIGVIRTFLPRQLEDGELARAVRSTLDEIGAAGLKDMGRAMAALKERYADRMDSTRASAMVKAALNGG